MNIQFNYFDSYSEGTHLYINIKNIERLISEDEKDGDMNHVFSLLNTFVYSIEDFIVNKYKGIVFFEKLTGGRLHLIIRNDDNLTKILMSLCEYSVSLATEIVTFNQYRSISSVKLQFGADSGSFVDYNFKDGDYEEYTSIGACANFACKLQCQANDFELLISEDTYSKLDETGRTLFASIDSDRQNILDLNKQGKKAYACYISAKRLIGAFSLNDFSSFINKARTYSNNHPLKEMNVISARKLNFERWAINANAKFQAAVVFADIRGFTKKFSPDGLNPALVRLTERVLREMYEGCNERSGVHVQFQGDREFAFFSDDKYSDSVIFALKLSKAIKQEQGLSIGVGINDGDVFATRVGKDSQFNNVSRQPVLIGKTVSLANRFEDEEARENEVVISSNIYKTLDDELKELFVLRKTYYVTSNDYDTFYDLKNRTIQEANHSRDYHKPWCND